MDNHDFEQLYESCVKQVFRFLLGLCGDYYIAEELTQETFVKAYQHIDRFQGSCKLSVWLCQIGKNLYLDRIKKEHRHVPLDDASSLHSTFDLEETALNSDTVRNILELVGRLPEPQQTIFLFRAAAQYSYREIGERYGHSEGWARVMYYRAKRVLQDKLKEEKHYEM